MKRRSFSVITSLVLILPVWLLVNSQGVNVGQIPTPFLDKQTTITGQLVPNINRGKNGGADYNSENMLQRPVEYFLYSLNDAEVKLTFSGARLAELALNFLQVRSNKNLTIYPDWDAHPELAAYTALSKIGRGNG